MSDEGGFDPCECIWGHEMAMRRLLSLLRQSQSYCTDTECFPNVIGPQQNQSLDNCFMVLIMTFMFAVVMFYFRPNSGRNNFLEDVSKPNNNNDNNDSNGTPPSPPPTAS